MKIKSGVAAVSDVGDKMRVMGQGRAVGATKWRPRVWVSAT